MQFKEMLRRVGWISIFRGLAKVHHPLRCMVYCCVERQCVLPEISTRAVLPRRDRDPTTRLGEEGIFFQVFSPSKDSWRINLLKRFLDFNIPNWKTFQVLPS
jgi:hypothetical protein